MGLPAEQQQTMIYDPGVSIRPVILQVLPAVLKLFLFHFHSFLQDFTMVFNSFHILS